MGKVLVLLLTSLIVMLTMSLMFTSVASAVKCCKCNEGNFFDTTYTSCGAPAICDEHGGYKGWYYENAPATSCGEECSNKTVTVE